MVSKFIFFIPLYIPVIPVLNPVSKSLTPPINSLSTAPYSWSLLYKSSAAFIILGRFTTAQPIKILPRKSIILPRNPLVLLTALWDVLLMAPIGDDASTSASLSFLLTDSRLILKNFALLVIFLLFAALLCVKDFDTDSADFFVEKTLCWSLSKDSLIPLKLLPELYAYAIRLHLHQHYIEV